MPMTKRRALWLAIALVAPSTYSISPPEKN
jgi:hypothetical protein